MLDSKSSNTRRSGGSGVCRRRRCCAQRRSRLQSFAAALTRARLPWGTPLPDDINVWPAAVRKNRLPSTFVKGARGEVGPPHFDLA